MPEKISVLISAYNYGRFLTECLSSVAVQTRPPDEIILVDDGSADETPYVARKFPQVTYIRQVNAGKSAAFNRAFAASTGDILCHLDADDYWEPTKLERVETELAADTKIAGIVHEVQPVDASGKTLTMPSTSLPEKQILTFPSTEGAGFLYPLPQLSGRVLGSINTISCRRSAVADVFPLPPKMGLGVDAALFVPALRDGVLYLPERLAAYRLHGANSWAGASDAEMHGIRVSEFLISLPGIRRALSQRHTDLFHATILEKKAFVASRTGENRVRGALAAAAVPMITLRHGLLCNWKHLALPLMCLLPIKRVRKAKRSPR